ncbi:MAG: dipeptidase [Bradymonadia bacterium]
MGPQLPPHVIDLHIDTFIPVRLWRYDVLRHHGRGPLRGRFFGHLDLPRMREAGLTGAMWSITTNPFRTARSRWRVFQHNMERIDALVAESGGQLAWATDAAGYHQARARGAHAMLLSIQGGNALEAPLRAGTVPTELLQRLTRVTVVHLTNASLGATSSPAHYMRRDKGLTDLGRDLIALLNAHRVFVDLAHAHPRTFWDAVEAHDGSQPLVATHTGICGVRPHWRNLDDAQIRAIADTGGVVGVIFAAAFLRRRGGPRGPEMVVEHLEHIRNVGGEACPAIGSDYDGAIIPPRGLRSGAELPAVVQVMTQRGWTTGQIEGALGGNFLKAFEALRH